MELRFGGSSEKDMLIDAFGVMFASVPIENGGVS